MASRSGGTGVIVFAVVIVLLVIILSYAAGYLLGRVIL